ncbi:hypothetical protein [Simiduia aestuariiviva]|uniref:Uncharacterized protein n=1 Tax=Simiduia aestuariiviva TaxID=1510459 RepID=A0A839UFY7_9GAMM|nr:hypothetical protein [Simiduia aestuariiviva]MBB3166954.1 hypothetical protein [Simiduia aestuariiviva]
MNIHKLAAYYFVSFIAIVLLLVVAAKIEGFFVDKTQHDVVATLNKAFEESGVNECFKNLSSYSTKTGTQTVDPAAIQDKVILIRLIGIFIKAALLVLGSYAMAWLVLTKSMHNKSNQQGPAAGTR